MHRAALVESLRAELRARAPFIGATEAATGLEGLDARLGGLPQGGICVVTGAAGAGRIQLAARILAERTQRGAPVAWVDATGALYPPALTAEGLELARLLMVRCADAEGIYAFEQILESGLFAATAATGLESWLTPPRMRRIQRAAEAGRGSGLVVLDPPSARAFTGAALRLRVEGRSAGGDLGIAIEKDRRGRGTGRLVVSMG